jgi:hypothetical protein
MNYGRIEGKIESDLTNGLSEFLNGLDQELGNELACDKYHYTADDGENGGPEGFLKVAQVLTRLLNLAGAVYFKVEPFSSLVSTARYLFPLKWRPVLLPRCYQDRTTQPHQPPCREHPVLWFLVG